jgi:transposase InsO family protein
VNHRARLVGADHRTETLAALSLRHFHGMHRTRCIHGETLRSQDHGLVGSMSRRSNRYDNGEAESFMKTIKSEKLSSE